MKTEEKKVLPGLTPKVIAFIIICLPIMLALNIVAYGFVRTPYLFGSSPGYVGGIWLIFVFIALSILLAKVSPVFKFSPQEQAVIFAALSIQVYATATGSMWLLGEPIWIAFREPYKTNLLSLQPSLWGPNDPSLIRDAIYGLAAGASIPWGDWAIPLVYWTLMFIALMLSQFFFGLLVRKIYIDIEQLPFPLVTPTQTIITTAEKGGLKGFIDKAFLVGVLIGAIAMLPDLWTFISPAPAVPWFGNTVFDLTPYLGSYLPGATLSFNVKHGYTVLAYLAPTDVILSAWIWGLIFWILYPPAGILTGILPAKGNYAAVDGPFLFGVMASTGMLIALGIWPLILHREQVAKIINAALGRGELPEETTDGLRYRDTLYLAAGTSLLLLLLFIVSGMPVLPAIALLVIFLLWNLGYMRATAESAARSPHYGTTFDMRYPLFLLGGFPANPSLTTSTFVTMASVPISMGGIDQTQTNLWATMGFMKLAKDTNTKASDMVKGITLIIVVCAIASVPMTLGLSYIYGLDAKLKGAAIIVSSSPGTILPAANSFTAVPGSPMSLTQALYIVVGLLLVPALSLLRVQVPWLPVNPVGVMLAGFSLMYAQACLLGWILKFLTLRIGGAKAYEKYGVPAASGFLVGYGVLLFLLNIYRLLTL